MLEAIIHKPNAIEIPKLSELKQRIQTHFLFGPGIPAKQEQEGQRQIEPEVLTFKAGLQEGIVYTIYAYPNSTSLRSDSPEYLDERIKIHDSSGNEVTGQIHVGEITLKGDTKEATIFDADNQPLVTLRNLDTEEEKRLLQDTTPYLAAPTQFSLRGEIKGITYDKMIKPGMGKLKPGKKFNRARRRVTGIVTYPFKNPFR